MTHRIALTFAALAAAACGRPAADQQEAAPPPRVNILEPADGAVFAAGDSVAVVLAVEHLRLAPAGTDEPGTGHHHLLVNRSLADEAAPIPVDSGIVHLGRAQTRHAFGGLAPGSYTVVAVLGDYLHVPIAGQVRDTVRFTVR